LHSSNQSESKQTENTDISENLPPETEQLALFAKALFGIMYDADLRTGKVKRSQEYVKLLGKKAENASESPEWWNSRIHPDDLQRVLRAFQTESDNCEVEYRIKHSDGHYLYIWDQAVIIKDENNKPIRIVGCNLDISRHKSIELQLRSAWLKEQKMRLDLERITKEVRNRQLAEQEALIRERRERARAEEANRAKDEFLANLSHELRSPLQSILGWIRLMKNSKLDAETSAHALDTIEHNTKAQVKIVNDLLDVSKIITGKARISMKSVDLKQIIGRAIDSILPGAQAKHLHTKFITNCNSVYILGDEDRLQQVFWNLLNNAMKFTPPNGSITISMTGIDQWAVVEITDTGIGIEPAFLPHVFERFRQGDSSTTKEHSGLGLGLAIVRHLIELHGGHISVESQGKGLGSTFRFSLLLQENQKSRLMDHHSDQQITSLQGSKILIVDDNLDTLDFLNRTLSELDSEVFLAESAHEALLLTEKFSPDIIISDLSMPLEDGHSMIKKVRSLFSEKHRNTPAIALTARSSETEKKKAFESGFQKFYCKPIEAEELILAIQELLKKVE